MTLVDAARSRIARLPGTPAQQPQGHVRQGDDRRREPELHRRGLSLGVGSAYRVGAGLVTVGAPQIIIPVLAGMLPEATWILLPHDMGVLNEAAR